MPSCCSAITLPLFLNAECDNRRQIDDEQASQYCESYKSAIPK